MSKYRKLTAAFRNYLLAGLAVWVPIIFTFYAVMTILKLIDGLFGKIVRTYFIEEIGFYIPGIGFVVTILFLCFTGFITSRFIGRRLFPAIEGIFSKVPLVKSIYPSAKQVADFVFSKEKLGLKKAILAEYPSQGIYQVGFITQERIHEINVKSRKELVGVLIPNTPYPLSGFLIFIPKEKVIVLDLSVEDAMKLLISGGVVKPGNHRYAKNGS